MHRQLPSLIFESTLLGCRDGGVAVPHSRRATLAPCKNCGAPEGVRCTADGVEAPRACRSRSRAAERLLVAEALHELECEDSDCERCAA